MGPSLQVWFLDAKQRLMDQKNKSLWVPALLCGFCIQNSAFWTRITSLCRWIDPTCGFCMQNSAFWTRVTSLYGSQTWPVVLCMYNSGINIRNTSLYGAQPSSVVFACKTAWLASESLVSMGPSPHVWFLDAKQRLLDPNNKSLWVPDITCRFVHAIQRD